MTVTIRKLDNTDHDYFAYTKSLCGKATYFVYFQDGIWGAITLHNFIEMLKSFFNQEKVKVSMSDKNIEIKNELFLKFIKE
ncbi:MAG: hypothetical protein DRH33_08280 [Candidatus Nealsonbacteria bacterium]|nr:MAG: hypothetical protein DRH33_08280 [Candidatus Nealsonbacteria bacterium]